MYKKELKMKNEIADVEIEETKQKQGDRVEEKESKNLDSNQIYIEALLQFAIHVRESTSYFFGGSISGKFRTQHKEEAFNIIIDKLKTSKLKNETIDPITTLCAIIHNAMHVRGLKKADKQTKSGGAVTRLLEQPQFEILKDLLDSEVGSLSYQHLKSFAQQNISGEMKDSSESTSPYFSLIKSHGLLPPPEFKAFILPIIADPEDAKHEVTFTKTSISIIKKNNGLHELVFHSTILKKFQRIIISAKSELNSFLDTLKPGQFITDPKFRLEILAICSKYGATPYKQTKLLNIFQNLLYWMNELQPEIAKRYQLPKALTTKQLRGICYGLSLTSLNKNHQFSELLKFACSLDLQSLQTLIKNGAIDGCENYSLEDLLLAYKKIYAWHDPEDLGIHQHNQYRTVLNGFWVNTLTVADNSSNNLQSIFQKVLVTTTFWEAVFIFPDEARHVVYIKQYPDGGFAYYDSNKSIADWFGPFKNLEILTEQIFDIYKKDFGNKEIILTANALEPMVKDDKFDLQITMLDHIFKDIPGVWINYAVKEYLSDKICRTEFARAVIPLLENLDPKIKQQLSTKQLAAISRARHFFRAFLVSKPCSAGFIDINQNLQFKNNGEFLKRLILLGDWRAALKILENRGPGMFRQALKLAVVFNQITVIRAFIAHAPPQSTGSSSMNKAFLDCFSVVKNVEVAGILLRALGIQAKTETDIWAQIIVFAAKHKDFNLLNRHEINTLLEGLIKIDKSDLSIAQKQKLGATIEQVFFHKLDHRYPLVPQTWTMSWYGSQSTSTTPSKDSIVAALSESQKLEYAEILTRFGYDHSEKCSTHHVIPRLDRGIQQAC